MKRFILLITMAVFTIIAISSCMRAMQSVELDKDIKNPFEVKIFTKGLDKPRIAPPLVPLKFGTNQSVTWKIKDNEELTFTIKFNKNGCPFKKRPCNFDNSDNNSGRAVEDPGPGNMRTYDYSVEVEGFDPIDPAIMIW